MAENKQTSSKVASTAGRILRDKKYGKDVRSLAGSALVQAKAKPKPKK